MKKFSKVVFAGALAFGGFTAVELAKPTTQAQAAVADDWPFKTFPELHHNINDNANLNVGNLKQGQTFTVHGSIGGGDEAVVKIYRVMDDMSLARYKTIYDSNPDEYVATFTTPITTAYDPGSYVAVMQYTFEFEGKIGYEYSHGQMFTISK
ncbi:DUF5065 family protein [Bacillus gaemokensis]|uniref:DUF5065 domain-containing protein n=1 Tax=Bacillus gaemokensis TaxID=574375 RepID=A0A073K484_9BACI|nr:DUF5065 family protein [Bacillus gaemokensis]KEK22104.1 hypothetical protein BAGA_22020 [Bacillus gaemokensis]KYG35534.1 hypothetical protein AZF08_26715 [Bacillus gaemokensis]